MNIRVKEILTKSDTPTDLVYRSKDNVLHRYEFYGSPQKDMGDYYVNVHFVPLMRMKIEKDDFFIDQSQPELGILQFSGIIFNGNILKSNCDMHATGIYCKKVLVTSQENIDIPEISKASLHEFVSRYTSYNSMYIPVVKNNWLSRRFGSNKQLIKFNKFNEIDLINKP